MARVINILKPILYGLAILGLAKANLSLAGTFEIYNRIGYEYLNIGTEQDRSALHGLSTVKMSTLGMDDMMQEHPLFTTVDLEVQYDYAEDRRSFDPRKAYMTVGWRNALELGAGENILIWGKGDELNPTDVINAERFDQFIVYNKGRRKLARPMTSLKLGLFETYFTFLALPSREQHIRPDPDNSRWCLGPCLRGDQQFISGTYAGKGMTVKFKELDPGTHDEPDYQTRYDRLGEDWEYAGKIEKSFADLDVSLMVHQGYERFPTYERRLLDRSTVLFNEIPAERLAYGGDFSMNLGAVVVRGEGIIKDHKAFMIAPDSSLWRSDADGIVYATEWEYVVGLDATLFWDIFTSVQYFERGDNSLFAGLIRADGSKLATFIARRNFFADDLELEYRTMVDTVDASSVQLPTATYHLSDMFSTSIQGNFFIGDDNTTFGDYFANNGALTSIQMEF